MRDLLPLFVNLAGRRVVLVGGGLVAASKLASLKAAAAKVLVVAPEVCVEVELADVEIARRAFVPSDLDGAWLVVAAATPEVNRAVAHAAEVRRVFVNAVDDPANATAFLSGVVRRRGVTLAISTSGESPGLTSLMRQALDAVLPRELGDWVEEARRQRQIWRRDGVPMGERRPLLLQALNRLYSSTAAHADDGEPLASHQRASPTEVGDPLAEGPASPGHVSLVGAGPGDPALLTREAVRRLRAADLVLYDALVDERALRIARRAQRFFVGKRAGRHSLSQDDIHAVMIRAARRGRRVVRLKGGDPFVFGRGGEEAVALADAGVPFDVVPGLTSAVAAPALAGIPVTFRGIASTLVVVSGHDERAFADLAARIAPARTTLVVLMGLTHRARLASTLVEAGWPASTPSALVAEASRPHQQVWRGTLEDLACDRAAFESNGPVMFVVGDVAALELTANRVTAQEESAVKIRGQAP
jgi:uroporphyrin-III C-methyltransferase/precorrin-2 dehydrogenase/sirohydrochlorin ferrochelatase